MKKIKMDLTEKSHICDNEELNFEISNILTAIFNRLNKHSLIPKINAIILTGSLTTNEISYIKENGKMKIYSDFDLILIMSKINYLLYRKKLPKISKELTNKILKVGTLKSHITLTPMTKSFLKNMRPTINNFAIQRSAKVIYGEEVMRLIPKFNKEDIIKDDAIEMLCNRMAGQLISYKKADWSYQNVKAALDCKEKVKKFVKYKTDYKKEDILRWYRYKINPGLLKSHDIEELWHDTNKMLINFFELLVKKRHTNIDKYVSNIKSLVKYFAFLICRPNLLYLKFGMHPKIHINLALYYYLKYVEEKDIKSLQKARDFIYYKRKNNFEKYLTSLWKDTGSSRVKVI